MSAQEHTDYMKGWNLYQFGAKPISACANEMQRRGWLAANKAEAVATLPADVAERLGY